MLTSVALHLAYLLQWRMEGAHIRHTFVFSYEQRGPSTLCSCHRPFVRKMWFCSLWKWKLSLLMQVVTWPGFCTCFQKASRSAAGCINIKHADQGSVLRTSLTQLAGFDCWRFHLILDCLVLRSSSRSCCHSNESVSLNLLGSRLISCKQD